MSGLTEEERRVWAAWKLNISQSADVVKDYGDRDLVHHLATCKNLRSLCICDNDLQRFDVTAWVDLFGNPKKYLVHLPPTMADDAQLLRTQLPKHRWPIVRAPPPLHDDESACC